MPRLSPSTIVLAIPVVASACVRDLASDVWTTSEAQRLFTINSEPPPVKRGDWETVRLPDYWRPDAQRGLTAWYRTTVTLDRDPDELWAVYLPRIGQAASAWVNGRLVGGGPDTDPLPGGRRPQDGSCRLRVRREAALLGRLGIGPARSVGRRGRR
jgi:hypothetical protein